MIEDEIKISMSKKGEVLVRYCVFEYYENSNVVKYKLHKIPIYGNISIFDKCNGFSSSITPCKKSSIKK